MNIHDVFLLPQAVDAHATAAPDHPAMRCLDSTLSYLELATRSNQLAHTLTDVGVARRDRIGICMDKCIDTPVALHGIMKAGAAYVPLDPAASTERIGAVIDDCGIDVVVAGDNKVSKLADLPPSLRPRLVIGPTARTAAPFSCRGWDEVATAAGTSAPSVRIIGDDLAYIIYTSGSTGRPKGIMHTHASGLSFSRWAVREYGLTADDVLSNHAPLHFDLSILDFFAGAVAGCETSIIPEAYTRMPASYSRLIADHRITVLYTVPFAMIQLLLRGVLEQRDLSALRWAIFGGEPFPIKHLAVLMEKLPRVRFDNIYGPAEVNGVTHYVVPPLRGDELSIPIGPLADQAEALIVDAADAIVPAGEAGELLVRSPTMMVGYWDRPALNAKAFYQRTPVPGHTEVFYRTGDLVSAREDGVLEFHGRMDRQIKVRGYRVELDEVESALAAMPAVEEVAAIPLPDTGGSQMIRAAVVLRDDAADVAESAILAHAKSVLPWYAVPAAIEIRTGFPRTSTGKIDKRTLREQCLEQADAAPAGEVATVEPPA